MEARSRNLPVLAPPMFDKENYQAWAVKMQAYMEGCDYWEAVEDDYEVAALPDNLTLNQIKNHKEMKTRKAKAKAYLYAAVPPAIFSRIMVCESTKTIWDFLKAEYQGDEMIKSMKVLNLVREFERLQMKESETIKEYSTKLIVIANKERMLGTDLSDNRLVQKILVSLPERYEATIASLENTRDLSQIKLAELVRALQAPEQRRSRRLKGSVEDALRAKVQHSSEGKEKKWKGKKGSDSKSEVAAGCRKQRRKIFSMQALCWLVDSGYTNHMTSDKKLFRNLDKSIKLRVRIGNGEYLAVEGRGTVAMKSCAGIKLISDVMYVPEID
ncbi:uncharacterized protein LOC109842467 [Asparagus officinalis]|uniref:uncharacterized protein LOC109842467 n=1 Tax=Asparagus officinalis TaxID=4686 RepID=UPI00098E459E|nr:uncharacterized protein LOC109842467 [Asparagus officinalis]